MFKNVNGQIVLEGKIMTVEQVVMILNKQRKDLKECYAEIVELKEELSEAENFMGCI